MDYRFTTKILGTGTFSPKTKRFTNQVLHVSKKSKIDDQKYQILGKAYLAVNMFDIVDENCHDYPEQHEREITIGREI